MDEWQTTVALALAAIDDGWYAEQAIGFTAKHPRYEEKFSRNHPFYALAAAARHRKLKPEPTIPGLVAQLERLQEQRQEDVLILQQRVRRRQAL